MFLRQFAPDVLLATPSIAEDALACRHDGDSKTLQWTRQITDALVDPATGLRHAVDLANHVLTSRPILQVHTKHTVSPVIRHLEPADVALVHQDLGDAPVQAVVQATHTLLTIPDGIPDSGQHVGGQILL